MNLTYRALVTPSIVVKELRAFGGKQTRNHHTVTPDHQTTGTPYLICKIFFFKQKGLKTRPPHNNTFKNLFLILFELSKFQLNTFYLYPHNNSGEGIMRFR